MDAGTEALSLVEPSVKDHLIAHSLVLQLHRCCAFASSHSSQRFCSAGFLFTADTGTRLLTVSKPLHSAFGGVELV